VARDWNARVPWWVWVLGVTLAAVAGLAPPLVTVVLVLALVAGVIFLKNPLWGAFAIILSVPVQDTITLPGGITITQVVFVFVLGLWWAWMSLRQDRRLVLTPIAVTLFLFLALVLPSLWGTTSMADSLAEISRWLVTIFAYIIIINSVQTRREMNWLIGVMLAAGLSEALLGLVQAYGQLGPTSFNVGGLLTRAYGTIGAPNSLAGYINMSLPLALALAAYHWGKWGSARKAAHPLDRPSFISWRYLRNPILMSTVTLILFWALVNSLSRGAWIALACGVLVMIFALGRRAKTAIAVLFAAVFLIVVLALAGAVPGVLSDRFNQLVTQIQIFDPRGITPTPDNYALVERMVHWQVAGNMFMSNPWTGVGFGNFNALFNKFGIQGWPYSRGNAHNYYLNVAAEAGVVGLTGYMIMLITAFTVGFRALRRVKLRNDTYGEAVVIGALGLLTTFAAHNFFEDLHALNMGIQWAAGLALFTLAWLRTDDGQTATDELRTGG
jgi:O-antigen ligase